MPARRFRKWTLPQLEAAASALEQQIAAGVVRVAYSVGGATEFVSRKEALAILDDLYDVIDEREQASAPEITRVVFRGAYRRNV